MRLMRLCSLCAFCIIRNKTMKELHEFPILIEETNNIITLLLNNEDIERAKRDKNVLFYIDLFNV